jgi:hypothetical protein
MRAGAVVAFLCVLLLASCSGDEDDSARIRATTTTAAMAARLCTGEPPVQVGVLQPPELTELSGLAASRTHDGVLWAHNDSGDTGRLFAIDPSGTLRATVALPVQPAAVDWEDLAISGDTIYIGDIGDNQRARTDIFVHEVKEPDLAATSAVATTSPLHYPDGAHDAEALMVDPVSQQLVIVTKEASGNSRVYTTPLAAPGPLTLVQDLSLGVGQLVTAGDISAAGDVIALRTYSDVFVWQRKGAESLAAALARPPCDAPAPADRQGETLALAPAGEHYMTSSEGAGSPVWQVRAGTGHRAAPLTSSPTAP